MEIEKRMKKLDALLEKLRSKSVFVEGRRDKTALQKLGFQKILTISGNLRLSCRKVRSRRVFVLTDLDRKGDQLAKLAKEELESRSISVDLEARKHLAYLLNIRCFEDAKRAYDELKGELNG